MSEYKPSGPFNVPFYLHSPKTVTQKGSSKKIYPETGELIYCTYRTFGGTEITTNNVLVVENTGIVETWYRPDITSDARLISTDGTTYEILGTPENINMRNQFLKFKIRAIRGGA